MHVVDPGDVLDADHAFMHRLVRQPGRADQIADRIDAGLAGAQPLVDDDMGALDLDLGAFEADILDIADDADGQDHPVDGDARTPFQPPRSVRGDMRRRCASAP